MNALLELVFSRRGYTPEYLLEIEQGDYALLKDIDVLCEHLYQILINQTPLVFLPDFDMDGIASGVVGFAGLSELGFNVSLFIPNPNDGYGFNQKVIDDLLVQYPDTQAILTADTGISCYDGINYAKSKGLKVYITDHHKQEKNGLTLNKADVVVDPMRIDETYLHPKICGAFVIYQVLEHFAKCYCDGYALEQIRRLCVFAGIGTISDIMPVLYENRVLIRDAISVCKFVYAEENLNTIGGSPKYRSVFLGLHLLLQAYTKRGTLVDENSIKEDFFGFYLAPMFNSIKRLGEDMNYAFGVFFGLNPDENIQSLLKFNDKRKQMISDYMQDIQNQDNPYAPYIYFSDAPSGILGLLATKLLSESGLPVLVLRQDGQKYHGSGRSPSWFLALSEFQNQGFYTGGHEGSFGIGVSDHLELKSLHAFMQKRVSELLATLDLKDDLVACDFIIATDGSGDTTVDVPLFRSYLRNLERFRPFGKDFSEPEACLKFHASDVIWSTMGSLGQHLKAVFPFGFTVISWNNGHLLDNLIEQGDIRMLGKLSMNHYGETSTCTFVGDILSPLCNEG